MNRMTAKLTGTFVLTAALTGLTGLSTAWADTLAPAPQPTKPAGPGNIAPAPQPTKPAGPADIAPAPQPTKPAGPKDLAPAPKPEDPKGPGDLAPAPKPTDPGVPDDKVSNGGGGGGTHPTGPGDLANPQHGCQVTHGCTPPGDDDSSTDGTDGSDSTDDAAAGTDGSATHSGLPFTGDYTLIAAEVGAGLLAAGIVVLVAARRRTA